jgi:HptB-dependent secretion and biofilm anti anti-sigma factor
MQAELKTERENAVIHLTGRFDFSSHTEFKQCYEAALTEPTVRRISVDLKSVEYLDSAALGMLLLLKERATARSLSVALVNCNGLVKELLDVANFGVVFEMQ